jgi:hypothetical protein
MLEAILLLPPRRALIAEIVRDVRPAAADRDAMIDLAAWLAAGGFVDAELFP